MALLVFGFAVTSATQAGEQQGMRGMAGKQVPDITPPIDSKKEAQAAASAWLQAMGGTGFAAGKVRDLEEIFVVNVVLKEQKEILRDQLVIRKFDGYIMSPFPFGVPGQGQDQKAGMSGMK